jgi:hypothetical protein
MEAKMDALISLLKMLILVLFVVRIVVIIYVLKEELEKKYKIKINYRTCWYSRQRAADKLFGKWDDSFN